MTPLLLYVLFANLGFSTLFIVLLAILIDRLEQRVRKLEEKCGK